MASFGCRVVINFPAVNPGKCIEANSRNSRQISGTSDASKTQLGLIRIYSIPLLLTADSSDEDWDQNWGDKRSENRSKHHRDSCSSTLHLSLDYRLGRALPV